MRRVLALVVLALLFVAASAVASAESHKVGPEQTYKTLRTLSMSPDLHDGDVIEVDSAGSYCGDVATWKANRLTIRGVGDGRPHLRACGASEEGKAIWVVRGADFTVENIEFSGAKVDGRNGAGIRAEGGGTLTVRNCYFHDNQNGILGGGLHASGATPETKSGEDVVLIENSVFEHNGDGDGQSHNLYISQRVGKLIFRNNLSHRANVGHNLKSRARKNYILYNMFRDGDDGNASFQIDLPNGGLSYLIGNVIHQGPAAENGTLVAYSLESSATPNPQQGLYVVNNTFVNTRPKGGKFLNLKPRQDNMTIALVRNNVLYGPGEPWPETEDITVIAEYNHIESRSNNEPRFADPGRYDFHPLPKSPLIDAGYDPGKARGYSLAPEYQYVTDAASEPRTTFGTIDIGAFEYSPPDTDH